MRIASAFIFVLLVASCTLKEDQAPHVKTYFDISGYFKNEAKRLAQKHQQVEKRVAINGKTETKRVAIKDWEKEFSIFINADINKDSWRGSFKVTETAGEKIFVSDSEKIPVRKVVVTEKDGVVKSVKLYVKGSNGLYLSQDTLAYFPDSLYQVKKLQKIKLLEEKRYEIIGRFVN